MEDWGYVDVWAKRFKLIEFLGGKCVKCGNDDFRILEFHHRNGEEKKFTINNIKNKKLNSILKEAQKCILLCPNCHYEEHYNHEFIVESQRRIAKKKLLELKGVYSCSKCGYNNFIGSLDFHHRYGEEKKFILSNINKCSKIKEFGIIVINELLKCDVLCKNCHSLEHVNVDKIEKYVDIIKNKQWRNNNTAPKEEIIRLYNIGHKQFEIVRMLNVPKSTVCTILKNNGDYGKSDRHVLGT